MSGDKGDLLSRDATVPRTVAPKLFVRFAHRVWSSFRSPYNNKKNPRHTDVCLGFLVEIRGIEPLTS